MEYFLNKGDSTSFLQTIHKVATIEIQTNQMHHWTEYVCFTSQQHCNICMEAVWNYI